MIFAIRFLPSNATAYALLALGPLTVYSQDAALETHGIAVNMDRSVNPGDDFYHYANGAWIERTEISPRPQLRWHLEFLDRLEPQAQRGPD
jgi:hypothetical protein